MKPIVYIAIRNEGEGIQYTGTLPKTSDVVEFEDYPGKLNFNVKSWFFFRENLSINMHAFFSVCTYTVHTNVRE